MEDVPEIDIGRLLDGGASAPSVATEIDRGMQGLGFLLPGRPRYRFTLAATPGRACPRLLRQAAGR